MLPTTGAKRSNSIVERLLHNAGSTVRGARAGSTHQPLPPVEAEAKAKAACPRMAAAAGAAGARRCRAAGAAVASCLGQSRQRGQEYRRATRARAVIVVAPCTGATTETRNCYCKHQRDGSPYRHGTTGNPEYRALARRASDCSGSERSADRARICRAARAR